MIKNVSPNKGGCWFCGCRSEEQDEPMYLESEFDSLVHISCVKKALRFEHENKEYQEHKRMEAELIAQDLLLGDKI